MTSIQIFVRACALNGIALLAAGGTTLAQPQSSSTALEAKRQISDTAFARRAAQGGMAEVKLSQLATEKGDNTTVKDFGKRMIQDHSTANDKLKAIASKDGISLPAKIDTRDETEYDRLSKLSGTSFDQAYARVMVTDHEKDIAEFKREAKSGTDANVKEFASQTLPTLEEHFTLAQAMLRTVTQGASSGEPLKPSR